MPSESGFFVKHLIAGLVIHLPLIRVCLIRKQRIKYLCSVKGIKPANPPSLLVSDFRLGGHTSQMTSPHRRGGGKSRRYRRLVTYEHADESRGESPHHHSAVRCRRSHTFSPLHTATSEYQPINGSVRYSLNSSHQRCEFLRPAINAASLAQPSTLRCLS
jgi:hypothetical protein